MTQTSKNTLIVLGIIVVLVLGYFAWKERGSIPAMPSLNATSTVATSTSVSVTTASSSSSGYTVHLISGNAPTPPNYKTPLSFSTSITADEQSALQTQYVAAVAAITANPSDLSAWIALGDVRKEAGDYAGAAADWQYVSEVSPTNIVSFANLGDLYTNFLPNYPLAAQNLQQEIKNNPTDVYIYDDLYQLYTHQYPQSSATIVAMLKKGIATNPGATELQTDLANYQ